MFALQKQTSLITVASPIIHETHNINKAIISDQNTNKKKSNNMAKP